MVQLMQSTIKIQENNKFENKANELEGKTNGTSHDSFTEASENVWQFFWNSKGRNQKWKQKIQCGLDEIHEKIWIIQSKPESFCISKFWYLISWLKTCEFQSTTYRGFEKKTKIGRRKRLSNVGTKSLSNLSISLKESTTWKTSLTWTSPLQRKQVNQWPVIQNYLPFKIKI